jgi:hypothetical protein
VFCFGFVFVCFFIFHVWRQFWLKSSIFGPLSQTTVPSSVFALEAQIEPEQGAALFVWQIEVN